MSDFLDRAVGPAALRSLHGLTETGPRPDDLYAELHFMRDLFYGLYLVASDDTGHHTEMTAAEAAAAEACYRTAVEWLGRALDDPDLAADTRVAVPVYTDPVNRKTRLWVTLGVRNAKLTAAYADSARPPRIKPA